MLGLKRVKLEAIPVRKPFLMTNEGESLKEELAVGELGYTTGWTG